MNRERPWEAKRVFSFGYDVRRILVGRKTREAIRNQAIALLDQLLKSREKDVDVSIALSNRYRLMRAF